MPKPANPTSFSFADAVRFWEHRRIHYNLALIAVVIFWLLMDWQHFHRAFNLASLGPLAVLALLANLCYTAAYAADAVVQHLLADSSWHSARWLLWIAGTILAVLLESYWINDEIYPGITPSAAVAQNQKVVS
jgi:hypothetical protein